MPTYGSQQAHGVLLQLLMLLQLNSGEADRSALVASLCGPLRWGCVQIPLPNFSTIVVIEVEGSGYV